MKTKKSGIPIQQLLPEFVGPGAYLLSNAAFALVNAKAIPPQTRLMVTASGGAQNISLQKRASGWKADFQLTFLNQPPASPERLLRNVFLIAAVRQMKRRGEKVQCTAYEPQKLTVWVSNLATGAEVLTEARASVRAICDEAAHLLRGVAPELNEFRRGLQ